MIFFDYMPNDGVVVMLIYYMVFLKHEQILCLLDKMLIILPVSHIGVPRLKYWLRLLFPGSY